MAKGGIREGAGRRPKMAGVKYFKDYWTEEEREAVIADLKDKYKENPKLLTLVIEQIWGRAPQGITLDGDFNHKYTIEFVLRNPATPTTLEAAADVGRPTPLSSDSNGAQIRENNGSS